MLELFRYIEQEFVSNFQTSRQISIGDGGTPFQSQLINAASSDEASKRLIDVAEQQLHKDAFVSDLRQLQFGEAYLRIAGELEGLIASNRGIPSLTDFFGTTLHRPVKDLVAAQKFSSDRDLLDDVLLAYKFSRQRGTARWAPLARVRRVIALMEQAVVCGGGITPEELAAFFRLPFTIDAHFFPHTVAPAPSHEPPGHEQNDRQKRLQELSQQVAALEDTWRTLMSVHPDDLESTLNGHEPYSSHPPVPSSESTLAARSTRATSVFAETLVSVRADAPQSSGRPTLPGQPAGVSSEVKPGSKAPASAAVGAAADLTVRPDAVERFPDRVRSTLSRLGIRADAMSLPRAVESVMASLVRASEELCQLAQRPTARVYRVGGHLFALQPPAEPMSAKLVLPLFSGAMFKPYLIGNLQVVKQELVGYEAGEISHIENVLQGETYKRETERQEVSELITTIETERMKSDERDLQSTERNETRQEAQSEARQSSTTIAGGTTTNSYGALVENRQSGYGKELADKAVNRVSERVRQVRTEREQKTFIEHSSHKFQNENGKNIRGVYQWVEKRFKMRVLSYGARLLYDVVLPEPATFFIDSLQRAQQPEGLDLVKPSPPQTQLGRGTRFSTATWTDLEPSDLNASNYMNYAREFGVTGTVEPPPVEFQTIVWTLEGTGNLAHRAAKINIPPGYKAFAGFCQRTDWRGKDDGAVKNGQAEVTIGVGFNLDLNNLSNRVSHKFTMSGETGELAITVGAGGMEGYNLAVSVVCRMDAAYEKWQLKTFTALMDGYRQQLAQYEERLSGMQAMIRTQMLLSKNYAHDPTLERTELKKAFIHLLMSEHFSQVSIRTPDPFALPYDLLLTKGWGSVVAFFERALEWENMLYYFYPYYWAREQRWAQLILVQDLDPQFEAFLKAGAARIVVPIRPGFEAALAHYQETGEVWFGKDLPEAFLENNVSILQEIGERNARPGEEKCVQEWEVKVPTTLVVLRDDGRLPEFQSNLQCAPNDQ